MPVKISNNAYKIQYSLSKPNPFCVLDRQVDSLYSVY
jgi:hypothetical protein